MIFRFNNIMESSKSLKWISLLCLTIQNVSAVLLIRYVRTRPGDMFSSSTAVVWTEVFKLISSILILLYAFRFDVRKLYHHLHDNIIKDPFDWLLIGVPAILYVLQNNLLFVAVSNLNAGMFQVCYQLKLLTTALFFRFMLKKPQSRVQWISLFVLFIGLATVQFDQTAPPKTSGSPRTENQMFGVFIVFVASLMSGFSGVFFEKILKTSPKDVWIRNIQLASYGVVFGLLTVLVAEHDTVFKHGFHFGYNYMVWTIVAVQSLGGLLVAVVIKYADNILKGFATSVAIVLAATISIPLFGVVPHFIFVVGTVLVITATILYSSFPYTAPMPPLSDSEKPSYLPHTSV